MVLKPLPYKNVAGAVPVPTGWLVLPARLAGVTLVAEEPFVVANVYELLDYRPKFDAVGLYAPIGFQDDPGAPFRPCDQEARAMIGWPRRASVRPTPSRAALHAKTLREARTFEPWLTNDDFRRMRWMRQVDQAVQPFHQRAIFSAHPDLSFFQLNGDRPLRTNPFHEDGVIERVGLIRDKLPGVDYFIYATPPAGALQYHVLQAAALLWTARRGVGRAVNRLPAEAAWDSTGLRMELAR